MNGYTCGRESVRQVEHTHRQSTSQLASYPQLCNIEQGGLVEAADRPLSWCYSLYFNRHMVRRLSTHCRLRLWRELQSTPLSGLTNFSTTILRMLQYSIILLLFLSGNDKRSEMLILKRLCIVFCYE